MDGDIEVASDVSGQMCACAANKRQQFRVPLNSTLQSDENDKQPYNPLTNIHS